MNNPCMAGGKKRPNTDMTEQQQKTTYAEAARAIKELYDSYVAVGFSEVQAFELLKTVLTTKRIIF